MTPPGPRTVSDPSGTVSSTLFGRDTHSQCTSSHCAQHSTKFSTEFGVQRRSFPVLNSYHYKFSPQLDTTQQLILTKLHHLHTNLSNHEHEGRLHLLLVGFRHCRPTPSFPTKRIHKEGENREGALRPLPDCWGSWVKGGVQPLLCRRDRTKR